MERNHSINSANGQSSTQAEKIESLLRSRYNQWIPAYELSDLALQYCARVNSIRRKLRNAGDWERIENKTERIGGQVRGSYRLVKTADLLGLNISNTPAPKSWEQVCAEREEKSRQSESWELVP